RPQHHRGHRADRSVREQVSREVQSVRIIRRTGRIDLSTSKQPGGRRLMEPTKTTHRVRVPLSRTVGSLVALVLAAGLIGAACTSGTSTSTRSPTPTSGSRGASPTLPSPFPL